MIIRAAQVEDAGQIAALWNGMIRDTLATFTTIEKTKEDITEMLADRRGAFWVAEDDALLGFVTYGPFRSGPGYVATVEHSIVLAPLARRKGIGRALMKRAMESAVAQGHHVMVAAISSANPNAVSFHESLGFDHVGSLPEVGRKADQWLDLILLQKILSRP